MAATLTLWGHALAALLFVAAALALRRQASTPLPRAATLMAMGLTAMWALAVAGIDARDVATRLVGQLRDVAWLAVVLIVARRAGRRGAAFASLPLVAMGLALLVAAVAAAEAAVPAAMGLAPALRDTRLVLHALELLAGLVVVAGAAGGRASATRLLTLALAVMWGFELATVAAVAGALTGVLPTLAAVRGAGFAGAALLLAAAAVRPEGEALAVSRAATVRIVSIVALAGYAGLTALLTAAAEMLGGAHARLVQTAIVFGATAALLTLLSTPWLRGWGKVMVAKHLFSHRYDYRAEWQRFSETLAGAGASPLGERVARAMAELTVSPGALLLCHEGQRLAAVAEWRWASEPPVGETMQLAQHLAASGRIVELDAVRAGRAPADERAAVPAALAADEQAWAIVPLIHLGTLVGAAVLARPPVDRALDWEDFDLLRVAGRQAAGTLAEDRARAALADAERFDEFNRRFAFILHDLKNLVSQLSLVARNAERHADNPAFRADMIATLRESSDRMQSLLARLSTHAVQHEPARPVEAARLVGLAARRAPAGRVEAHAPAALWLLADAAALDTVLDHLVQNAMEASEPGVPVSVTASDHDGGVALVVADRGCGMDASFVRDRLFRPFVSTKAGGFGLGAFEARQMVEAMGGHLLVDSREGEGTRMTIVLPRAASPAIRLEAA